jgi:hypothetical protein
MEDYFLTYSLIPYLKIMDSLEKVEGKILTILLPEKMKVVLLRYTKNKRKIDLL